MMAKLTQEQIDQAIAWREKGWSCRAIAQRLGVSDGAIKYQCLKNGAISPRQKGRENYTGPQSFIGKDGRTFSRFTDEDDHRLIKLANAGLKVGEIAKQMGRANTSIRMRLLLLGQHEDIAAQREAA